MADRVTIERVIRQAYDGRLANDVEATMKDFHAHASFTVSGTPGVGKSPMTAKGEAEVGAALKGLVAAYEFLDVEFLNLLVDGHQAASRVRTRMRVNATGEIIETDLGHFWTIEDGKVASVVEFHDTALVNHLHDKAKAA